MLLKKRTEKEESNPPLNPLVGSRSLEQVDHFVWKCQLEQEVSSLLQVLVYLRGVVHLHLCTLQRQEASLVLSLGKPLLWSQTW